METDLFTYAAIIFGTLFAVKYVFFRDRWEKVAVVQKLYIHPLKSGKGKPAKAVHCYLHGLRISDSDLRDRCFMAIQPSGVALSGRASPKLVLVELSFSGNVAKVNAPGMKTLTFNLPKFTSSSSTEKKCQVLGWNVPGMDCGEEAAQWFENYTGEKGVRLVFHAPKMDFKLNAKLCNFKNLDVYNKKPIMAEFQNWSPVNILSQSSLDDLNKRLNEDVTERNFRTNILVSGCPAYAEDKWRRIRIGSSELAFGRQCSRCSMPTVSPESGIKHAQQEPIATLKKYRSVTKEEEKKLYSVNPLFSSEYVVVKEGEFKVGDIVYCMK